MVLIASSLLAAAGQTTDLTEDLGKLGAEAWALSRRGPQTVPFRGSSGQHPPGLALAARRVPWTASITDWLVCERELPKAVVHDGLNTFPSGCGGWMLPWLRNKQSRPEIVGAFYSRSKCGSGRGMWARLAWSGPAATVVGWASYGQLPEAHRKRGVTSVHPSEGAEGTVPCPMYRVHRPHISYVEFYMKNV